MSINKQPKFVSQIWTPLIRFCQWGI